MGIDFPMEGELIPSAAVVHPMCWIERRPMQVLLAESDKKSGEDLRLALLRHGYEMEVADSGASALRSYEEFDLILLDLELPDIDGLEVCRTIRQSSDIPIISFTGQGAEIDRVLSLQAGSDDCIVKPYGLRELIARINAVMRRASPSVRRDRVMSFGTLCIDGEGRQVYLDDEPVKLTRKEFDLLHLLASQPATVFTREQLMRQIWGVKPGSGSLAGGLTRTIDTHASSIRGKLGSSEWIITVRGVGFRFGG
ncbi:response regulator transcription factor [Streptomyces anulatus]|uniref:response regulator transcription factor n=1 Tax=Streptomyces TaxID=1883 RepID=UPI001FFC3FDD|nr:MULTISPECIES: response regulator transcription factor [Streptomyces]MDQ0695132.1 DNA-binding response OmpR family regulator [Streptomyces sp. W4I9-2]MDX3483810.1 response regulator transcription factor [Streptomyces sp. ID05-18]WIY79447.1 response regulator transcription factor [Streptomyces anulatus]